MSTNLIEQAVRMKLRFESPKGLLTTEQLYDLPFTSKSGCDLQAVAAIANNVLKQIGETDFVGLVSNSTSVAQLRLDTIKHVIATLKAEQTERMSRQNKSAAKQRLLELLARKKAQELEGKSPEELQAMIDALQ